MDCIKAAYPTSLESLFSMINVAFGTGRPGLCIKHGPKSYVSKEKSREGVIPLPAISKRYLEPLTICNGDVLNSKKDSVFKKVQSFYYKLSNTSNVQCDICTRGSPKMLSFDLPRNKLFILHRLQVNTKE